jgi:DNA-binding MarR family transcriptional regulator
MDEEEDTKLHMLRNAVLGVVRREESTQLTLRHLGVFLVCCACEKPPTIGALERTVGIQQSGITSALDALHSLDIVVRKRNPNNPCSNIAVLTEKGSLFIDRLRQAMNEAQVHTQ